MPVALVTDSTAYLPPELIERLGVTIVPLQVLLAGKAFDENEIEPGQVAQALRDGTPVTTSRPSPAMFGAAYARLAQEGYDAAVSVHLSGEMSGTVGSARLAAAGTDWPVQVVDSRSLGMGLGYAVLSAGDALAAGADPLEAARAAQARAANSNALFYVDTLDHLRRGGRIGAAKVLMGSALAIKPLLRLDDGRIVPLENVRTSARGIARLAEIAAGLAPPGRQVDLAVHHLDAPDRATRLADEMSARLPGLRILTVSEVGAVVGAHVGPGMLAIVVAPVP